MRKFLIYIFLFSFTLHVSSKLFVTLNFYLNQEYIAKNLCENKSKPALKCNGKCQLQKDLKKDEDRKDQKQSVESTIILFISETIPALQLTNHLYLTNQEHIANQLIKNQIHFTAPIFHPPII